MRDELKYSLASSMMFVGVLGMSNLHAQQGCGDWVAWPTDSPGTVSNILLDTAFFAPARGLTVGSWNSGLGPRPMVLQWDGAGWSGVDLPDTSNLGTSPQTDGVGLAGADTWVVGNVRTGYPTNNMPLVMRREGEQWERVATPTLRTQNTYPFADRGGFAYDIAGVSENDLWVVGSAAGFGDGSATSVPLALHFDGSDWEDVDVPLVGNRHHELNDVSASSSDNVWAVGDWRSIAQNFKALIVRWDGSRWHHVPNPGEGDAGGDAQCVVALAPDDVWVSGNFNAGADHLIHWNGSSWDVVDAGLPGPFAALAAHAPDDIWGSCAINATIYHYDGSTWTPAGGNDIPGSTFILRGWGLAAVGACEVWAVGAWSDGTLQRTLAERLMPASCRADLTGDGAADSNDFFAYLDLFASGDPAADITGNGVIDADDFFAYLDLFAQGC